VERRRKGRRMMAGRRDSIKSSFFFAKFIMPPNPSE
jgi:hypothetical protein